jgi:tRNA C32,U32 (ribose-2'-O)-methylase TrmJ
MRLTIILVGPARAENVGAAARAMKTMGFRDLRIVDSEAHLAPAARWVAHGSGDILDGITTYPPLLRRCTTSILPSPPPPAVARGFTITPRRSSCCRCWRRRRSG